MFVLWKEAECIRSHLYCDGRLFISQKRLGVGNKSNRPQQALAGHSASGFKVSFQIGLSCDRGCLFFLFFEQIARGHFSTSLAIRHGQVTRSSWWIKVRSGVPHPQAWPLKNSRCSPPWPFSFPGNPGNWAWKVGRSLDPWLSLWRSTGKLWMEAHCGLCVIEK